MKALHKAALIGALMAVLLAGCEKEPEPPALPEMNAETCKPENIAKLDKAVQEAFSSQCLRAGSFKSSEPKTW